MLNPAALDFENVSEVVAGDLVESACTVARHSMRPSSTPRGRQ